MAIELDGANLTIEQVVDVARNGTQISLSSGTRDKLQKTRDLIDREWMNDDAPLIYSFNTGVGLFKDRRVTIDKIEAFQTKLILAHATGVGEPFDEDVARAIMLLRLNAFASDYSGVTLKVADRIAEFLNLGLTPVIPAKGSVGASGDLAPLAHMSGALLGMEFAEVFYHGRRLKAADAIREAGLAPTVEMESKDASALINGSTVSLAIAVLALHDAEQIARQADLSLCFTLEALRGEKDAFTPGIHAARPHPGQAQVARNVLKIIGDSQRMTEEARLTVYPEEARAEGQAPSPRVQDVYSLRCAPQVHGPVREALQYIRGIVAREVNAATDNPLIVTEEGGRRAVSGGHFHGQYIAQAMDLMAMVMTDLSSISERRLARVIDPGMSFGMPRNLASGQPGLNTGYGTVQCSLSALVMENRTLSMPGSVDSIPGKGNAEDHVSNSTWCARKAATIVKNARMVVAGEFLISGQALSMVEEISADHKLADATREMLDTLRDVIPARLEGDVWFAMDMEAADALVRRGELLVACEAVTGPLE